MNCLYCNTKIEEKESFCSMTCKTKWQLKEDVIAPKIISVKLKDSDVELQRKFIKNLGKKVAIEKLCLSGGVILK